MKIVVTGALGHIGSRLIRDLPATFRAAEIVMIDNLSTQRYASLFDLPKQGRYRFIEADILTADLNALFERADCVIHLAALTNAPESVNHRNLYYRVNDHGARRVADACLRAAAPLLFASTTSVYGRAGGTVREDGPAADLRPQSPYAESKLRAEAYLDKLGRRGLDFVTVRFGTVFGPSPGMRFHTAVNRFCWQAVMGEPLTIWRARLHQKRPYLDLSDASRAVRFFIRRRLFDRRVYNVLTLNTTVSCVVRAVRARVPATAVRYVDSKIMNQLSYNVSNQRVRQSGFRFTGNLDRGVRQTISRIIRSNSG